MNSRLKRRYWIKRIMIIFKIIDLRSVFSVSYYVQTIPWLFLYLVHSYCMLNTYWMISSGSMKSTVEFKYSWIKMNIIKNRVYKRKMLSNEMWEFTQQAARVRHSLASTPTVTEEITSIELYQWKDTKRRN